jgi:hypothetical protein
MHGYSVDHVYDISTATMIDKCSITRQYHHYDTGKIGPLP